MLFSVITVCRNNLNELILTHASLSGQNCPDYEWIVIDGGSTDGTKEWLEGNHDPARWISENDAGIYDAMNKGAAMANGDYLVFMNSGDEFYDPNVLSKIELVIRESSSTAATGKAGVAIDHNKIITHRLQAGWKTTT